MRLMQDGVIILCNENKTRQPNKSFKSKVTVCNVPTLRYNNIKGRKIFATYFYPTYKNTKSVYFSRWKPLNVPPRHINRIPRIWYLYAIIRVYYTRVVFSNRNNNIITTITTYVKTSRFTSIGIHYVCVTSLFRLLRIFFTGPDCTLFAIK